MGELHLQIYVERMKREYGVEVQVSNVHDCNNSGVSILMEYIYIYIYTWHFIRLELHR